MEDVFYRIDSSLNEVGEEAYNVLRTNIKYFEFEKEIKTISVTSYNPGEGKTTTSMNLGLSMAKAGAKVLVVDADLRKPMMLKKMGREDFKGLSNFILGRVKLDEIINSTALENLSFIACGVKVGNPSELIGSTRFIEFLQNVRNRFDVVIIDTPPLGSVIDSAIISARTDGTIIVIEPGKVSYQKVERMRDQLKKVNANLLGVVLNKVNEIDYRNYYGGYDYYGERKKYFKEWLKNFVKPKR